MSNSTSTSSDYDYFDEVREVLADAGFMPLEGFETGADYADEYGDELEITDRDAKVLHYFAERRWEAFRIEPTDASAWATLARWTEDGASLLVIDRNGCIEGEITLPPSARGNTWLAAVLEA